MTYTTRLTPDGWVTLEGHPPPPGPLPTGTTPTEDGWLVLTDERGDGR